MSNAAEREGSILSGKREVTDTLSRALEKHIDPHGDSRIYWAKEVSFDYATSETCRVDYMLFKPKNNTISGIEKGERHIPGFNLIERQESNSDNDKRRFF